MLLFLLTPLNRNRHLGTYNSKLKAIPKLNNTIPNTKPRNRTITRPTTQFTNKNAENK